MDDWLTVTGIVANLAVVGGALWAVYSYKNAQETSDRDWDAKLLAKASEAITNYMARKPEGRPDRLLLGIILRVEHVQWQFRTLPHLKQELKDWAHAATPLAKESRKDMDEAGRVQETIRNAYIGLYP